MKKTTIEAIIGVFAGILLIWSIGVITATNTAQYMYGANVGFITGITIIVCLRNRENAKKNAKKTSDSTL
ncbi:unnamed protein product [marine sediment metagenome]|uniref:Uncharacterized protein n=1 Tax=marine sediment metagenome TaxID=412755 RepID=X1BPE8_9ZZZZ